MQMCKTRFRAFDYQFRSQGYVWRAFVLLIPQNTPLEEAVMWSFYDRVRFSDHFALNALARLPKGVNRDIFAKVHKVSKQLAFHLNM